MIHTGIWPTARNRPAHLARSAPPPEGSETTFEQFMVGVKSVGMNLVVQDLDELAQFALEGIRNEDFVIMIDRQSIEAQLNERAAKLARGACPIEFAFMGFD